MLQYCLIYSFRVWIIQPYALWYRIITQIRNAWSHIVVVLRVNTNGVYAGQIYEGARTSGFSRFSWGPVTGFTKHSKLALGSSTVDTATDNIVASIDEIAFWDKPLTEDEVNSLITAYRSKS